MELSVRHDLYHDVDILFWLEVDYTATTATSFLDHKVRLLFDEPLAHVQMMVGIVRLGNHGRPTTVGKSDVAPSPAQSLNIISEAWSVCI